MLSDVGRTAEVAAAANDEADALISDSTPDSRDEIETLRGTGPPSTEMVRMMSSGRWARTGMTSEWFLRCAQSRGDKFSWMASPTHALSLPGPIKTQYQHRSTLSRHRGLAPADINTSATSACPHRQQRCSGVWPSTLLSLTRAPPVVISNRATSACPYAAARDNAVLPDCSRENVRGRKLSKKHRNVVTHHSLCLHICAGFQQQLYYMSFAFGCSPQQWCASTLTKTPRETLPTTESTGKCGVRTTSACSNSAPNRRSNTAISRSPK
jgi:hypothetical protein